MMCEKKKRLLTAYDRSVNYHSRQVTELVKAVGSVAPAAYEIIRHEVESSRILAEKARLEFDAHVVEHKC